MMQNNYDDAIAMVNEHYYKQKEKYKKYVIQKNESLKYKKIKQLKIRRKITVTLTAGVLTICASAFALGFDYGVQADETIVENQSTIISIEPANDTNQNKELVVEEDANYELFSKYCNSVYPINPDIAYNLAIKLTDNFNSDEYLETLNPGFKISKIKANNKEHGIVLFLRHLYQKPQDFGVSKNDIINYNFSPVEKGNEEYKVKYYSDMFGIDKILVLAIEYQEASKDGIYYNSNAYINYNNPAGLMNPNNTNELWKFPSSDAGIIEHIYQLKKNYIDKGLDTPSKIKYKYAPDGATNDPNNLNQYWINGVNKFMEGLKNNESIFNDITINEKNSAMKN